MIEGHQLQECTHPPWGILGSSSVT